MRIAAFGLLIFYHVGMLYVSWGFHIKSAHRITALEPLMLVLNPWRLSVLFLVLGVATGSCCANTRLPRCSGRGSARLLIPLVFGMVVIVPPQAYDQIVEASGYPAGFCDFYLRHYWAFGPQFCPKPCIVLPTWNHLWFVVYLWVYTMALGAVLMALPGLTGWPSASLAPALSGALLLIVPSLSFAAYRIVLLPGFPSTHALFGDWYNHALFATVFLFGFLLAHAKAFWDAIERLRWIALSLAAFFLSFLALREAAISACRCRIYTAGSPMASISGFAWSPCSALPGAGSTGISAARRYLTDAIFPYYIVHQTAIIMIAHALHGSDCRWRRSSIVVAGTAAACVADL